MANSANQRRGKLPTRFFNPATIFLFAGLLIGILYCVFIPYGAGFDEEQHQMRILDITYRHLLPNRMENQTRTYGEFFDLSYQRRYFNDPATDMFTPEKLSLKLDDRNKVSLVTRSIYTPVSLLPQAAAAFVTLRRLNLPVLPSIMIERLAGLLMYLAGAYAAIRLVPFGKWTLAVLALAPGALFQAATLNADGYTNAVCFLFIAATLRLYAFHDRPLQWRETALLALLMILVGLAKPGYMMILPLALLLLTPGRFASKKLYAVLWAAFIAAVGITFAWMSVSVTNTSMSAGGERDLFQKLDIILADPLNFISAYFKGIVMSFQQYYTDWVGVYGYWAGYVPRPVYWIFPVALFFALLCESGVKEFPLKGRISLFVMFLISSGAIVFLYSYLHYTAETEAISVRQGRYYTATAPLLFLSLSGLASLRPVFQKAAALLAVGLLAVTTGYYSLGLYATYYTECGYSQFAGTSCLLPQYKNLDKTPYAPSYRLFGKSTLRQTFTNHCGKMTSVRVFIKSIPASAQGSLTFSLLDSHQRLLASEDFDLRQIQAGNYLYLPVKPAVGNEGSVYEIRLAAPQLEQNSGIEILMRKKNYYQEGLTYISGEQSDQDMVFNYTCPNRSKQ